MSLLRENTMGDGSYINYLTYSKFSTCPIFKHDK